MGKLQRSAQLSPAQLNSALADIISKLSSLAMESFGKVWPDGTAFHEPTGA